MDIVGNPENYVSVYVSKEEMRNIPLDLIVVNPFQPRRYFSEESLRELSQSIQTIGLIHPPAVRPRQDGTFELISGERRFRACQLAGFKTIPVVVRESSHAASAQAALIENIQRVDLNPLEIAKALRGLIEQFGFDQEEVAMRIGKKRSTVSGYLRLLSLPKGIQDGIASELITMGHAKAILSLEGFDKQNLLYGIITRDDLSVREAEEAAARISQKAKKQKLVYANRDFYLEQVAEKMQKKLGTKVFIQGKGKRGRVSIDYYSLDDLDRLIGLLGADS